MQEVNLTEAVDVLSRGDILIYPTETLYGLGVDISNPTAIQNLLRLKGREADKPISILIPGLESINLLVKELSDKASNLIKKFFPGPLTLVLPASPKISPLLHANTGWIGLRISSHPLAQQLVQNFAQAITTTSANLSGQASGYRLDQLRQYFQNQKGVFLLSAGDLPPSKGSTVVQVEATGIKLLREGEIPFREIQAEYDRKSI